MLGDLFMFGQGSNLTVRDGDRVSVPKTMWFRFPTKPVMNTIAVWAAMKTTIHNRIAK